METLAAIPPPHECRAADIIWENAYYLCSVRRVEPDFFFFRAENDDLIMIAILAEYCSVIACNTRFCFLPTTTNEGLHREHMVESSIQKKGTKRYIKPTESDSAQIL